MIAIMEETRCQFIAANFSNFPSVFLLLMLALRERISATISSKILPIQLFKHLQGKSVCLSQRDPILKPSRFSPRLSSWALMKQLDVISPLKLFSASLFSHRWGQTAGGKKCRERHGHLTETERDRKPKTKTLKSFEWFIHFQRNTAEESEERENHRCRFCFWCCYTYFPHAPTHAFDWQICQHCHFSLTVSPLRSLAQISFDYPPLAFRCSEPQPESRSGTHSIFSTLFTNGIILMLCFWRSVFSGWAHLSGIVF